MIPTMTLCATETAALIRNGTCSALEILADTEARIRARDPLLNCFTTTTFERARREAAAIDAAIDASKASGAPLPPLAGVRMRSRICLTSKASSRFAAARSTRATHWRNRMPNCLPAWGRLVQLWCVR